MASGAVEIDARGHRCPTPTLRLRRGLEALCGGDIAILWADDPLAGIDVPHFVREGGHALLEIVQEGDAWRFSVRKGG